jgi:hypothetical protein
VVGRWPASVGEAIARNAWPARIARDGTLHVNTADAIWAFELGHNAAEIAARLEVPRIRFAPGPVPGPEPERPSPSPLAPTAAQEEQAAAVASPIEDADVRQSVQKAVLFSLARNAADRSL